LIEEYEVVVSIVKVGIASALDNKVVVIVAFGLGAYAAFVGTA
jgi:hypothetical protein